MDYYSLSYTVFAAIVGAVFGSSFYNVVGLRVPKKESIVQPPSHCTNCQRRLTVLDLVPIFSYVFLRGKCRSCHTKIAPIYPFMELVTAVLFAVAYYQIGWNLELFVALAFISLLIIITITDIAYMLIPNKILGFFLVVLAIGRIISPLNPWWSSIGGALLGFSLLLIIAVVSKGGMGGGDIKLFFIIGMVLGISHTLLSLFFAAVIGLIIGGIMLRKNKQSKKEPIPFGPSIAIAAIIVYFYGTRILHWYGSII